MGFYEYGAPLGGPWALGAPLQNSVMPVGEHSDYMIVLSIEISYK